LPLSVIGYANAARLRDALKPRSDVDTVAEDIAVIDDDITDMDADAKFDPDILLDLGVPPGHAALNFHSAARCIHGAGKLNQHAVAGGLDDATAMRGDGRIDEGFLYGLKLGQRAFLIEAHETAIPGDIRRQDRCQSPFDTLGGQRIPLDLQFQPSTSKHIGLLLD
jgi:hypothetical protein